MAIFHFSAKVISRGKGQSAIAAAAYRSGDRLRDEQADQQKYYVARAERIQFTGIMAPGHAPDWARDRNALWNEAERAEKRKDAQLAREIEVSLPHELTEQQREWLVKDFAREAFVRKGYAVDIAIHAPDKASDERNHHAHLMITMRRLEMGGFAAKKDPTMNSREQLGEWREQWANLANRHLERHGHAERIDHRSLKAQGLDQEPTVHLGYAAKEMDARGAQSDRADELRAVKSRNAIRGEVKGIEQEIAILEKALATERAAAAEAAKKMPEWSQLAKAARLDEQALRTPWAHQFGQTIRGAAQSEAKAQREAGRQSAADWQQERWRMQRDAHDPGKVSPVDQGLKVVDGMTGKISGVADYMTDFLAGSSKPAEPELRKFDMDAYLNGDAATRKEQRMLMRAAEERAAAIDKTLLNMRENMEKGQALRSEDLAALPYAAQLNIRSKGDDAVRNMIDEAWKRQEKALGRERERD
jgi:MobA/MobL family